MWYEIIPIALIIGTCSAIPCWVSPYINKFFSGNPAVRNFNSEVSRIGFARDYETNGKQFWKFNGLDAIPDK